MVEYLTNPDDREINDCVLTLTNEGALYPTFRMMAERNASINEWMIIFEQVCMPYIIKSGGACRYGLRRDVANRLRLYYEEHIAEG